MEAKRADKGKQERKRSVTGRLAVTFKAGRELKPGQSLDLANCSDVKIQAIESSTYILKAEK